MKTLNDYLIAQKPEPATVKEFLSLALGICCLSWAASNMFNSEGFQRTLGFIFGPFVRAQRDDVDDEPKTKMERKRERLMKKIQHEKDKQELKELEKELDDLKKQNRGESENDEMTEEDKFNSLVLANHFGKQYAENEKDEEKREAAKSFIALQEASMYDENGNPRPVNEIGEHFQKYMGDVDMTEFKEKAEETLKSMNNEELGEQAKQALNNISPEDFENIKNESKSAGLDTQKKIQEAIDNGETPEVVKQAAKHCGVEIPETPKNDEEKPEEEKPEEEKPEEEKPEEEKPEGDEEKKEETPSNAEIDKLQDKLTDDDLDKDEKKEVEKELKDAAEKTGKDPEELVPQEVKGKNGKIYQKKVGPRGGKYYRQKGKEKWIHGTPANEGLVNYIKSRLIAD